MKNKYYSYSDGTSTIQGLKTEVTYRIWDDDGTLLCDITEQLADANINMNRSVEPIFGPDGKIKEFTIGQTTLSITGLMINPEHTIYPFVVATVHTPMVPPPKKTIEDLEREMYDWVAGNNDKHDEVIAQYKKQILDEIQQKQNDPEVDQDKLALFTMFLSKQDPGLLMAKDGKIVVKSNGDER